MFSVRQYISVHLRTHLYSGSFGHLKVRFHIKNDAYIPETISLHPRKAVETAGETGVSMYCDGSCKFYNNKRSLSLLSETLHSQRRRPRSKITSARCSLRNGATSWYPVIISISIHLVRSQETRVSFAHPQAGSPVCHRYPFGGVIVMLAQVSYSLCAAQKPLLVHIRAYFRDRM